MNEKEKNNQTTDNTKMFYIIFFILGFIVAIVLNTSFGMYFRMHKPYDNQERYKGFMQNSNNEQMKAHMQDMSANLNGKTGSELEQSFLEEMIPHHEGAIQMAEKIQNQTQRPELKQLAENIIKAQNEEITMMKTWLKNWFNVDYK